jgi:hypothetical protein
MITNVSARRWVTFSKPKAWRAVGDKARRLVWGEIRVANPEFVRGGLTNLTSNRATCALARAAFAAAIAEKPAGRFMIRSRTRVVKRHPDGDW